jgi:hypothetical protein
MDYAAAKARRDDLEAAHRAATARLCAESGTERGAFGMIPDAVKAKPEWRSAYRAERVAFETLRTFNGWYVKRFASELRADRARRLPAA